MTYYRNTVPCLNYGGGGGGASINYYLKILPSSSSSVLIFQPVSADYPQVIELLGLRVYKNDSSQCELHTIYISISYYSSRSSTKIADIYH